MKITLSACDPYARKIFESIVRGWKEAGGTVSSKRPGRIFLILNTKAHTIGNIVRIPHKFNLAVLASPRGKQGAHIQVSWNLWNTNYSWAYLDCNPDAVARFEQRVASLPGFVQKKYLTCLMIDKKFKSSHAKLLMDSMKEVKDAEAKTQ